MAKLTVGDPIPKATLKDIEGATVEFTAVKSFAFRRRRYWKLPVTSPIIAKHFLKKHCDILNIETKQFAPAAVRRLQLYPWPGNARQLENEVKRLVASVRGLTIGADHLDPPREPAQADSREKAHSFDGKTIDEVVENIERRMVETALKENDRNKQKAAQVLGLSPQGL